MKKIIRRILKEDIQEQFLNKIILLMKDDYPIYKKLDDYGFNLSDQELIYVLSGIFGEPVIKKRQRIYNQNGNQIYFENSFRYWVKWGYDENGNIIYYEDSEGYWEKFEYDDNGNKIYSYDSEGYWKKFEYDDNGNKIYFENSYGDWVKFEYDDNGNEIYYETSRGDIIDNR